MYELWDTKDPITIQLGGQAHQGITCNINTDCSQVVHKVTDADCWLWRSWSLDRHTCTIWAYKWQILLIVGCDVYHWALLVCNAMNLHIFATVYTQYNNRRQWAVDTRTHTHIGQWTRMRTHTSIVPMIFLPRKEFPLHVHALLLLHLHVHVSIKTWYSDQYYTVPCTYLIWLHPLSKRNLTQFGWDVLLAGDISTADGELLQWVAHFWRMRIQISSFEHFSTQISCTSVAWVGQT